MGFGTDPFDGCLSLKAIDVSEENPCFCSVDGVLYSKDRKTLIRYPIKKDGETYDVPDGVKEVSYNAFKGCSQLKSVTLPEKVKRIAAWTFDGCSALENVVIPPRVKEIGFSAFGRCSSLKSLVLPDGVKSIDMSAFVDCSSLTSIVIPESVVEIENTAFCDAQSVTVVAPKGSFAEEFAKKRKMKFKPLE